MTLLVLLSCKSTSSPDYQDKVQIEDILADIATDFTWENIPGIMEHVHPDYYHKGMYDYQLRELWLDRRAQYELLEISVLNVDISGDYATASMRLTFTTADGSLSYLDPETSGDASYFFYDAGAWKLYGNRQLSKPK